MESVSTVLIPTFTEDDIDTIIVDVDGGDIYFLLIEIEATRGLRSNLEILTIVKNYLSGKVYLCACGTRKRNRLEKSAVVPMKRDDYRRNAIGIRCECGIVFMSTISSFSLKGLRGPFFGRGRDSGTPGKRTSRSIEMFLRTPR